MGESDPIRCTRQESGPLDRPQYRVASWPIHTEIQREHLPIIGEVVICFKRIEAHNHLLVHKVQDRIGHQSLNVLVIHDQMAYPVDTHAKPQANLFDDSE